MATRLNIRLTGPAEQLLEGLQERAGGEVTPKDIVIDALVIYHAIASKVEDGGQVMTEVGDKRYYLSSALLESFYARGRERREAEAQRRGNSEKKPREAREEDLVF